MRNSIAILVISSCALFSRAQITFTAKDTLRFASDSSYSRSVQRLSKYMLIFATSKTGVIVKNELKHQNTIITPSADGEFRDYYRGYGMISGDNGLITRGKDTLLYKKGMFFDAVDGNDEKMIILADPVNGRFPLFLVDTKTHDQVEITGPQAIGDEACYAASGTTIQWISDSAIVFVSGGTEATRFHRSDDFGKTWQSVNLPMSKGQGCGPFSVHFVSKKKGIAVGGCYTDPGNIDGTCVYTSDGGETWFPSQVMPNGYRSCITGTKKVLFACGTNGIDFSTDGGKTWQFFDKGNFCAMLLEKKHLYVTTNKGYCIRYKLR